MRSQGMFGAKPLPSSVTATPFSFSATAQSAPMGFSGLATFGSSSAAPASGTWGQSLPLSGGQPTAPGGIGGGLFGGKYQKDKEYLLVYVLWEKYMYMYTIIQMYI